VQILGSGTEMKFILEKNNILFHMLFSQHQNKTNCINWRMICVTWLFVTNKRGRPPCFNLITLNQLNTFCRNWLVISALNINCLPCWTKSSQNIHILYYLWHVTKTKFSSQTHQLKFFFLQRARKIKDALHHLLKCTSFDKLMYFLENSKPS
jgi:hypothetical protein